MPNFEHIDKFKTQDHVVTPHGEGIIVSRTEEFADVDVEGTIQKCSLMRCVLKSEALERDGKVTCWDLMDKSVRSKVAFESGVNMPNISALWEDIPEQHQNLIKAGAMERGKPYEANDDRVALPKGVRSGDGKKQTRSARTRSSIQSGNAFVNSLEGKYGIQTRQTATYPNSPDGKNFASQHNRPAIKADFFSKSLDVKAKVFADWLSKAVPRNNTSVSGVSLPKGKKPTTAQVLQGQARERNATTKPAKPMSDSGRSAIKGDINGVTLTDIVKAWRDGERMSATRKAEMEEIINYAIDAGYVGKATPKAGAQTFGLPKGHSQDVNDKNFRLGLRRTVGRGERNAEVGTARQRYDRNIRDQNYGKNVARPMNESRRSPRRSNPQQTDMFGPKRTPPQNQTANAAIKSVKLSKAFLGIRKDQSTYLDKGLARIVHGSLRRITKTEYARNNAVSLSKAGGYVGMDKDATSEGRGWTTGLERNWDNPTLPKGKKPTSDQKIRTMGISAHQSRNVEGRKVHDKRQDPKNRAINPVTMPKNKASALQGTYLAKGLRRIG